MAAGESRLTCSALARTATTPNARRLRLSKHGLEPVTLEDIDHYRLFREFCVNPNAFIDSMMDG